MYQICMYTFSFIKLQGLYIDIKYEAYLKKEIEQEQIVHTWALNAMTNEKTRVKPFSIKKLLLFIGF